uniref:Reverse transcriptase zinc-binding domain-containing protein n=1 Tax=Oryza alta TaxID=52545 RepID=A0A1V1H972_9ORYZ|nr:hypothetical protein [Oryza alta]
MDAELFSGKTGGYWRNHYANKTLWSPWYPESHLRQPSNSPILKQLVENLSFTNQQDIHRDRQQQQLGIRLAEQRTAKGFTSLHGYLQQNGYQRRKTFMPKPLCPHRKCEICHLEDETASHFCLSCPFAATFWASIGIDPGITDVRNLANIKPPACIPIAHHRSFLLCFWGLWNHRHEVVFRNLQPCLRRLLSRCIEDANLWAERF